MTRRDTLFTLAAIAVLCVGSVIIKDVNSKNPCSGSAKAAQVQAEPNNFADERPLAVGPISTRMVMLVDGIARLESKLGSTHSLNCELAKQHLQYSRDALKAARTAFEEDSEPFAHLIRMVALADFEFEHACELAGVKPETLLSTEKAEEVEQKGE